MTKPVLFWYECLMKQQGVLLTDFSVCPYVIFLMQRTYFMCSKKLFNIFCIPWGNVVGFSSDTANVMVGKNNSVLSHVREATHGNVHDLGCVSHHMANLCANNLVKTVILITTVIEWPGRMKRVQTYADNTVMLMFYFLQYALSRLNKFNTTTNVLRRFLLDNKHKISHFHRR